MEDNGLEQPKKTQEKPHTVPVYAINTTRAQFQKLIEAMQTVLLPAQLQGLCDIAETFEPIQTNSSGPTQNSNTLGRVASTPEC